MGLQRSNRPGSPSSTVKVLIVASLRYPIGEPFAGGLEAHTWSLAKGLRARGHSVTVAGRRGGDPAVVTHEIEPLPAVSDLDRADTTEHPTIRRAERAAYDELFDQIRDGMLGSFDVIHNNSLHPVPIERSGALPAPLVTTLHTPLLPWAEQMLVEGRRPATTGTFVAVSRATAALWRPVVPARVVRNGVDTTVWRAGPGGPGAVWSGRIVPEKAPHLAIELARAAGVDVTLAGPVIDRDYFARAIRPRLGPGVRYAGHLGQSDLARLAGHSGVALVTPVWNEPFGLVAAEAMACGTPVVAFGRGGLPEVVPPAAGRILPAVSADGFRADQLDVAVRAVAQARALDRRIVRRLAVARLGGAAMVRGYERVYGDAVRRWSS